MAPSIDYSDYMHRAMRDLVRHVLRDVAVDGLPGDHHFFITFDTTQPGVDLADWLRSRYPGDMTVVMQHWFEDLIVEEEYFAVTLNFGGSTERLVIPFNAVRTFVDPSVEFGLRFEEGGGEDAEDLDEEVEEAPIEEEAAAEASSDPQGQVVSLDSFRKS